MAADDGAGGDGRTPGDEPRDRAPASGDDEPVRDRTQTPSRGRSAPRRFPGWILVPLGGLVGWAVSGWWGAAFGVGLGILAWWGRR